MPTSAIPSSNASAFSLASLPARVSASGALGLRPRLKTSVSESPRHDHVDLKRRNIREQLKKLKVDVCKQFSTLLQPLAQIVSCDAIQFYQSIISCKLLLCNLYLVYYSFAAVTYSISIVRKIMEHFPHVKLYKVLLTVESDLRPIAHDLGVSIMPTFLFYQNGVKVDEVVGGYADPVMDMCEKLYRYVRPIETPQRTRSSWKGKTDTQQLVLQAKKDENDVVVAGGWKVGDGSMFFQWKGGAVAVDSSDVPSVSEVMKDVESLCTAPKGFSMWCFAKGLFTAKPEKRVIFSNIKDPGLKIGWFREEMEVE
ncbi:uncharacterized protein LOC126619435 isoform X13 [Malus sylvestris]|uniref:uncharacterized protein LOC126619435 isoform X13 n=1 Tax=Malus sylvestris TaxID=3752 RepID=UPI0021ABD036|nr:uncharacterized protein LOC126619435 isoform X13 [Malus sylvestris]